MNKNITLTPNDLRRIEEAHHQLRRRNGELLTTLEKEAPDAYNKLIPISDFPIQYLITQGIHNHAVAILQAHHNNEPLEPILETLNDTISLYNDYWEETAREVERRKWEATLKHLKKRYKRGEDITNEAAEFAAHCRDRHQQHTTETNLALGA